MDYGTLLEHFLCYNNKCTNRLLPENKGGEERMKKKAWRSLLSLLLAFTMVCSIWTPAFAKSEATEDLEAGPAAYDQFGRHNQDGSNLVVDEETVNSSIVEEIKVVTKDDTLTIPLAETGGAAIHYVPKDKVQEEAPAITEAKLITDRLIELDWDQDVTGADEKASFQVMVNGQEAELNDYGYNAGN